MMATYVIESHKNWDEHLTSFSMCLGSMVNDTTGVSPALLNLGRKIVLPIDRVLDDTEKDYSKSFKDLAKNSKIAAEGNAKNK